MKLSQEQLEGLLEDSSLHYRGNDLVAICPFCHSSTREFGISLKDNHVFNCYRKKECGVTGNIFTLLAHLGKSKEFLGDREVNVFQQIATSLVDNERVVEEVVLPEVIAPPLWRRVKDDTYLRKRGFSDDQFRKFEVGRSKLHKDYVTFLVRQEGRLVGYVGRSEKSKVEIDRINEERRKKGEKDYLRYNNSSTDFALTLFGYDELIQGATTDVILVEGIFSKTKTDRNLGLDDQEEMKCVATLGAKLSDYQIFLLKKKGIKRLIVWFEPDVLQKIKTILSRASLDFEVLACYLGAKDPNDLNEEEALELLGNSKDWFNFNMSYI